jgi:hypothetical protein
VRDEVTGQVLTAAPQGREDGFMPRDEVDDTDMTPAAFRAAQAAGQRVRVVGSRAEFQASMDLNAPQPKPYVLNKYVSLAFSGMSSGGKNLPAAAARRS